MSELVSYAANDGVAKIIIQNGKVNALSNQVFDELNAALDQAEQDKAVVILSGQPGMFSAGYDLKEMQKDPDAALALVKKGSTFARRLMSFPLPVIGASSGHAIAKGTFLLLSCDYRIGVSGEFKLGLNETAIGMTMHHAGIEIARYRMPPTFFNRSVLNAEMYDPDTAVSAGILDEVVAPQELETRAEEMAKQLKTLNPHAFKGTKVKMREAFLQGLDECIAIDASTGL